MPTQELRLACTPAEILAARPWPRAFVLDGGGPQSWGSGFAFFGHTPRATLRIDAAGIAHRVDGHTRRVVSGDPFAALEEFRQLPIKMIDSPPVPFAGGIVGVFSYDLRRWIERVPCRAPDDQGLPVLEFGWYDWALLYDHRTGEWRLASAYLTADALAAIGREIVCAARRVAPPPAPPATSVSSNFTRADYIGAVRRAQDYIAAGDIYQVNLAQRFAATAREPAPALFGRLQRQHPMPFAAFVDCDDYAVVSNSPECFLQLGDGAIATFPIKGTRPRGRDNASDVGAALALRSDAKEAAEHVMIVDLERNDLGRLCVPGSVTVDSFAAVSSYPTVHHLVSDVRGRLRPGVALPEILRATFPGGSITGAPKIRAMEIIDELEPVQRGPYTGAVGFIDARGHGVLNIAIRTIIARARQLTFHAGGAIVADSDPAHEYAETLLKAEAFFMACAAAPPGQEWVESFQ